MTDPIDLLTAAQDGTVALLRAQLPDDQKAMVRHTLLQNTQPPFHLVGDVDSDNQGSKGEQLEDITVDVHTVYRGSDRRMLSAMMHQVRLAADGKTLTSNGASLRFRWKGAASGSTADGTTHAGVTTLTITAEPA